MKLKLDKIYGKGHSDKIVALSQIPAKFTVLEIEAIADGFRVKFNTLKKSKGL